MSRDRELTSRRSTFRGGRGLRLADGEVWNFPHPAATPPHDGGEVSHRDLTLAICEADDEYDRGLAELALAIYLLNLNYELSPRDLRELLTFEPGSEALREWRAGLREIVTSHVQFLRGVSRAATASTIRHAEESAFSRSYARWFSWLRSPSPARR